MNKIFAKDFWNWEHLKERLRQLSETFPAVINEILKPANGKLDRKYKLALSLVAVVLLAVGSWVVGSKIQSPAEAAARTAPPTPSSSGRPPGRQRVSQTLVKSALNANGKYS